MFQKYVLKESFIVIFVFKYFGFEKKLYTIGTMGLYNI